MRLKLGIATLYAVFVAAMVGLVGVGVLAGEASVSSPQAAQRAETIYIKNLAPFYMSNAAIERDIPGWEKALNQDFAPVWETPQVEIKLLHGRAPRGAIVATFQKTGSIQGALAYHTMTRGVPSITVYTGVGDFYGFSNSVSFTHEVEELLADQFVSGANMGVGQEVYVGQKSYPFPIGSLFVNETADPVEAYQYMRDGAAISDFVTPNYFGDGAQGGFDFMGVLTHPFQIARGGYQIVWQDNTWQTIVNFRGAGRDAAGFLKGEKLERR